MPEIGCCTRSPALWRVGEALIVLTSLLGATLHPLPAIAVQAAASENVAVLARAREAVVALTANLRTARVEGRFRMWAPDGTGLQSVRFSGAFDGPKEYLKLVYEPPAPGVPLEYDQRIAVCDGSELFVGNFSPRIHPVPAEASVFPGGSGSLYSATHGFPEGLRELANGVLSVEALEKNAVEFERLASGHYRGTSHVTPTDRTVLEIAPELGYHCILAESFKDGKLIYRWTVVWKQAGDLWYAASGTKEAFFDSHHEASYEWQFDEFEPNVPISPELFTLSALELPPGARIIDRRTSTATPVSVAGDARTHYLPKMYRVPDTESKTAQTRADRLVDQVEAMPKLRERPVASSAWPARVWGVAIGLLGLVAIAIVWFTCRRAGTAGNDR